MTAMTTDKRPKDSTPADSPPSYRDLSAGDVVRAESALPRMLATAPEGRDGLLLTITFTDGTSIVTNPDDKPMDVVTFYDYEIDSTSPRNTSGRTWAHPDDLEAEVKRLRELGRTDIRWRLRAVCKETYRVCYGNR
jgi:hypothetical protein